MREEKLITENDVDSMHTKKYCDGAPLVTHLKPICGVYSGVAKGWTGVDMSTPLLPKVIPEIDANPMTFLAARRGWGASVSGLVWHLKFMG